MSTSYTKTIAILNKTTTTAKTTTKNPTLFAVAKTNIYLYLHYCFGGNFKFVNILKAIKTHETVSGIDKYTVQC